FPVDVIEKIEVIKGPGSVLYGSGAFAGVINIITEKPEKTGVTLIGLAGEEGALDATGKVSYAGDEVSVLAAAKNYTINDWETDWSYFDSILLTKITKEVSITDTGTGGFVDVNYKNFRVMSSINQWQKFYAIPDFASFFQADGNITMKKEFANVGYSHEMSDKLSMDVNGSLTRSRARVTHWPGYDRDSHEILGEVTGFYTASDELRLVFGGTYRLITAVEHNEGFVEASLDADRYDAALYTQADYWVNDTLKLIGGIQGNKVEDIDDMGIVPRVGVIKYLVPELNVKALYSSAFRAPSLHQVYLDFPGLKGDTDNTSELVDTIDVGLNYNKEKLQGSVNYFYSQIEDLIYQDRSNPVDPVYANGGELTIQGFECEGKYYATREFLLLASALYQQSEDDDDNDHVTPIPEMSGKLGVSYMADSGITVGLFDNYHGDFDSIYDTVDGNPSPEAYNTLDLNCRFEMGKLSTASLWEDVTFLVRVDNLTDEEIWLPNWQMLPGQSIPVTQGRTAYVGAEVAF
ncbi:MAG: TonB-dependent receptor, partial [Elusimicrobia bacterium]|nr:TonB-dependent receptor [Elusimicrobiota bacterium]